MNDSGTSVKYSWPTIEHQYDICNQSIILAINTIPTTQHRSLPHFHPPVTLSISSRNPERHTIFLLVLALVLVALARHMAIQDGELFILFLFLFLLVFFVMLLSPI